MIGAHLEFFTDVLFLLGRDAMVAAGATDVLVHESILSRVE